MPPGPWRTSDDTVMAAVLVEHLLAHGRVDQDALALAFARAYAEEPERGYGAVACWILTRIGEGEPWREIAKKPFGGTGSMGNGGAMRVAPLGAWCADDITAAVRAAVLSAEVTHAHPEGQAGAAAVAAAAVYAWRARRDPAAARPAEALELVVRHTPDGPTKRGLREATRLLDASPDRAAQALGDGSEVTSPDTVPYAIWCAVTSIGDYSEALWRAMSGLLSPGADRDTVCAIVGGIVALATGSAGIPAAWLTAREPLGWRRPTSNG